MAGEVFTQIKTEQIGADLSKVVDRITRQYESFNIAFQKEAIQNSWDVREDREEGKGWFFKISEFVEGSKTHLVVEDFGTKGMNTKRWEAFQSLWRPEKDHIDAGGQGQGKFVLMGASNDHVLIVESINEEIGYRCKFLRNETKSRDDEKYSITDFISRAQSLNHKGTRVWVYNVRKDFLKTLHSQEFIEVIIESWWQILGPRFNAKIIIFNKEVIFPSIPLPAEENILLENCSLNGFGRIKRLYLAFYEKPIPEIFRGVRVQRANMMIIKIPFDVHDKEYQGRFSGYIEFDEALEKQLKGIEKTDHCGFLYESPWKEVKALVKEEAEKFVSKIVPSREQRRVLNIRNLSEVIKKANQIINEYCPEILGGSTVVPPIPPQPKPPLRIKYLVINKREVKYGDTIKASCNVLNETNEDEKIVLHVELKRSGAKVLDEEYSLKVKAGGSKPVKLSEIKLVQEKFEKGKYTLRVTLKEGRHDIDTKSTSFYLEIKRGPVKRGFIKEIRFLGTDEPWRNKQVIGGILTINFEHRDFLNIQSAFEEKPNIQNKQIGFYLIKLCLDEAARELLKLKFKNEGSQDIDDIVQEVREIQDRMYYDVHI